MKRSYEEPLIEVIQFNTQDIMASSGEPGMGEGEEEL